MRSFKKSLNLKSEKKAVLKVGCKPKAFSQNVANVMNPISYIFPLRSIE